MTTPLTRLRADGTREYYCSTTKRYYVPEVAHTDPDGHVWTFCTCCDTAGRTLLYGRDPQPHCYPLEGESHE